MNNNFKLDLGTDAGMLALWDYDHFSHIDDYDKWEESICEDEDILEHIKNSRFVPINLGDGGFGLDLRINQNTTLTDRENKYLLVSSRAYKLRVENFICVSSLENVGSEVSDTQKFKIESGTYTVIAHLIDWTQEDGAFDKDGQPSSNALPDLIIFIHKESELQKSYCLDLETFRKEDVIKN